jgi:enoyl-CoA hydratase/carnithine racemase
VLRELAEILGALGRRSRAPAVVLSSDHPTVFLAGADLREIADLDARTCVAYARAGRAVVEALESYPGPTVAAVNGSCSGGGFDISLACDVVVAGPRASFVHPGVQRGLVTAWTGTTTVPAAIGRSGARNSLLTAALLDRQAMEACGTVVPAVGDPVEFARREALRLSGLDPARRALWRQLRRGRFVDRFRAVVLHK